MDREKFVGVTAYEVETILAAFAASLAETKTVNKSGVSEGGDRGVRGRSFISEFVNGTKTPHETGRPAEAIRAS